MVSKKFVFLAVASAFTAGATLASNVSFGQRAARWIAENLEFMGPVTTLVGSVVRNTDLAGSRPALSYQKEGNFTSGVGTGNLRSGASDVVLYSGGYMTAQQVVNGFRGSSDLVPTLDSGGSRLLVAGGVASDFTGVASKLDSSISQLAKSFLRKGSLFDEKELWNVLANTDSLKGELAYTPASVAVVGSGSGEVPVVLAAAASGDSLVSASSVVGSATSSQITSEALSASPGRASALSATVPAPGAALLLGLGIGLLAVGGRKLRAIKG